MTSTESSFDQLRRALTSGGDERTELSPDTGLNRYHLNPANFERVFNRGSCTAGMLNPRSLRIATEFLTRAEKVNYETLVEEQAQRIRSLVGSEFNEPFDVFFGPSGTDLAYLPVLFQQVLNPELDLLHIVSCPEELGSGSINAAAAKFFGNQNQFGEAIPMGEPISPLALAPEVIELEARDASGHILERRTKILELIADNPDAAIVGSLVFGSKSGIKDDLQVVSHGDDKVMWVVDLCQFRVDPELVHDLLHEGAMVMLTGSKFFQAPPFCGALLVPRKWSEMLREKDAASAAPFGQVFSAFDIPWALQNLRDHLPSNENWGLRMRWEIALDEMEAFASWPREQAMGVIDEWNGRVSDLLEDHAAFRLMPDQDKTNSSIVSAQVLVQGRELGHDELRDLHRTVVTTTHEGFSNGVDHVFLGQPVQYGERSFLRFAVGSPAVREMLTQGSVDLTEDRRLVQVVADHAARLFG